MNTIGDTVSTTEKEAVAPVADPEAYKKLSARIRECVEETDNPKSAKSHKRFLEVQELLGGVKILINDKTRKIRELREANVELTNRCSELSQIADAEPVAHLLELRRMPSAYTGVSRMTASEVIDTYQVYRDVPSVLSHLKPMIDEAGVVAMIVDNGAFQHKVPFHCFIGKIEAELGRKLDIDNNQEDALLVYRKAMGYAIDIADVAAKHFGAQSFLMAGDTGTEEFPEIRGWSVGSPDALPQLDSEEDDDAGDDDDSDEPEGTGVGDDSDDSDEEEGGPSEDDIRQRLGDDDDDIETDEGM